MIRIGIIIPDRNDRPKFLQNCLRMLRAQTVQPQMVEVVNDPTIFKPTEKDITWRYRLGYERLRDKGLDVIFFIENDDYYAPNFIETMLKKWEANNRPDLFGTNYTVYYNLPWKKFVTLTHLRRSTMASTIIKPDMDFKWCVDTEPYTDSWLWSRSKLKGVTVNPDSNIFIGIKHGIGLTGGGFHSDRQDYYDKHGWADADSSWLKNNMDLESFKFYTCDLH